MHQVTLSSKRNLYHVYLYRLRRKRMTTRVLDRNWELYIVRRIVASVARSTCGMTWCRGELNAHEVRRVFWFTRLLVVGKGRLLHPGRTLHKSGAANRCMLVICTRWAVKIGYRWPEQSIHVEEMPSEEVRFSSCYQFSEPFLICPASSLRSCRPWVSGVVSRGVYDDLVAVERSVQRDDRCFRPCKSAEICLRILHEVI